MTDLQDAVDGIGQQFAVLRMHVTHMTPAVSQSDDILFLMSIVSVAWAEPRRIINQPLRPQLSHRKDSLMNSRSALSWKIFETTQTLCSPADTLQTAVPRLFSPGAHWSGKWHALERNAEHARGTLKFWSCLSELRFVACRWLNVNAVCVTCFISVLLQDLDILLDFKCQQTQ